MAQILEVGNERWSVKLEISVGPNEEPVWKATCPDIGPDWRELGEAESARRYKLLGDWLLTLASERAGAAYLESKGYVPAPGELRPDLNRVPPHVRIAYEAHKYKTRADVLLAEANAVNEGFLYD